jgi:hypothetical protein
MSKKNLPATLPKSEWKELPKWIPLHDFVCLVDPQFAETPKAILLADNARRGRYVKATVHAVGPEVKTAKPGEVWFLPDRKGEAVKDGDTLYLFWHEEELLGKEVK